MLPAETSCEMINDLLLNQMFTKVDISKVMHVPIKVVNQVLINNAPEEELLKDYQVQLLSKLYKRMRSFENRIDGCFVMIERSKQVKYNHHPSSL